MFVCLDCGGSVVTFLQETPMHRADNPWTPRTRARKAVKPTSEVRALSILHLA